MWTQTKSDQLQQPSLQWLGGNCLQLSNSRNAWPHMAIAAEAKPADTKPAWTVLAVYPTSELGRCVAQKLCAAIIGIGKWSPRLFGTEPKVPPMMLGVDYVVYSDPPAVPHIRLNGHVRFVGPGSMKCSLDEEDFAAFLPGDTDG